MAKSATKKRLAVALQGGGSHGAFTWGVLDRLLEVEELELIAISGTSAGAMNGVMLAYGMHLGGRQGARELLTRFWERIALNGLSGPIQPTLWDKLLSQGDLEYSAGYHAFIMMSQMLSPYQFNPLNINPLRDTLLDLVDFDELRKARFTQLFLAATNVRTIRSRIFTLDEMTVECVLASACLPQFFHTVEINGEAYWDGGYMGNPPIFPLIEKTDTQDVLLIQINPILSTKVPSTAAEIEDRLNEISFNSSLMWEMRWINLKNKMVRSGIAQDKYREIYVHAISADEALSFLGYSSKLNTTWEFLMQLFEIGRRYGEQWLNANLSHVGQGSTVDVEKVYL